MRRHGGQLAISQVVLLEARNVFSRVTGEREPREWQMLEGDIDGKINLEPMNWDSLRQGCTALFSKYAWKANIGTFDTVIIASAKLAGATRFLSFDDTAKAIAFAEGMEVFPLLDSKGKRLAASLSK